jgi:hypothetical protein
MKSVGQWITRCVILFVTPLLLAGCSDLSKIRHTLRDVGADKLRAQTLAVCREGFAAGSPARIDAARWPESARVFQPLGLWAEPDGAYLLIDSDADGERGIYLPRILSEKDPLCSPILKHVKLGAGVYWYDRKRS